MEKKGQWLFVVFILSISQMTADYWALWSNDITAAADLLLDQRSNILNSFFKVSTLTNKHD